MKFIRKGGRIIPLREKSNGDVDKRHVSDQDMAKSASKQKISGKRVAAGVSTGLVAGKLAFGNKGAAVMGLIGGLAGLTKITNKQDVANKLKRKKKY
jgi:hypothetical protein